MHFLRAGVDKRFDAYKAPHPAATGQVDVVGGFKVIAAVILAPVVGYVWIGGYWTWTGHRHEWMPGRWEAPRSGYRWVEPRWQRDGQQWRQMRGGWQPEGRPPGMAPPAT